MSLDGWSNVHNEPIICVTVTTSDGALHFVNSVDTSGHSHTADYLVEVAQESISKCESEFGCSVSSLVTDNTVNVKSMREELEVNKELDLLTYGCSAHLLNLLAKDIQIKDVKEHVTHIVKYFRNNHFAAAKLKEEGGLKLVLPQDVRWSSLTNCLESFIKHWPILMKISEEHRGKIDNIVFNKVSNIAIKRNAESLLCRLKPVALSVDSVQKNSCTISEAVEVWKKLEESLNELKLDKTCMASFIKRYNQALGPPHFLANLIDPRFCGNKLTDIEKKTALSFAKKKYSNSFMPLIMKCFSRSDPFYDFLFEENIVSQMTALNWWRSHFNLSVCGPADQKAIKQLLIATASSASVERLFSTYGLVHSKLRNKLGNEKAAKLVFLYKAFNIAG